MKIKKIFFKSKHLFCAQFKTETGGPYLERWKNTNILKQFLSEIIHAQENGSRSTHFAKSLISNFL